jgi:hypothetical protein
MTESPRCHSRDNDIIEALVRQVVGHLEHMKQEFEKDMKQYLQHVISEVKGKVTDNTKG